MLIMAKNVWRMKKQLHRPWEKKQLGFRSFLEREVLLLLPGVQLSLPDFSRGRISHVLIDTSPVVGMPRQPFKKQCCQETRKSTLYAMIWGIWRFSAMLYCCNKQPSPLKQKCNCFDMLLRCDQNGFGAIFFFLQKMYSRLQQSIMWEFSSDKETRRAFLMNLANLSFEKKWVVVYIWCCHAFLADTTRENEGVL